MVHFGQPIAARWLPRFDGETSGAATHARRRRLSSCTLPARPRTETLAGHSATSSDKRQFRGFSAERKRHARGHCLGKLGRSRSVRTTTALGARRGAAQAEALARVLRALDGGSQLAMSINHRIPAVRFHVRQAVKQMEIDDMAIINQCPKDTANASLRYTALEQIEQLSIPDSQRVRVAAQLGTLLGAASNRFRN